MLVFTLRLRRRWNSYSDWEHAHDVVRILSHWLKDGGCRHIGFRKTADSCYCLTAWSIFTKFGGCVTISIQNISMTSNNAQWLTVRLADIAILNFEKTDSVYIIDECSRTRVGMLRSPHQCNAIHIANNYTEKLPSPKLWLANVCIWNSSMTLCAQSDAESWNCMATRIDRPAMAYKKTASVVLSDTR